MLVFMLGGASVILLVAFGATIVAREREGSRTPVVVGVKTVGQWKRLLTVRVTDSQGGELVRRAR